MPTEPRKVLNFLAPLPKTQKEFEDEVCKRARMICKKNKICTDDFRTSHLWNKYNSAKTDAEKDLEIFNAAQTIACTTNMWD